jgi:hypothetical protein
MPTNWTVILQKDKWNNGFNGILGEWVANFGAGAYTTTNFASTDINFAFKNPATSVPVSNVFGDSSIIPSNRNETALIDIEY